MAEPTSTPTGYYIPTLAYAADATQDPRQPITGGVNQNYIPTGATTTLGLPITLHAMTLPANARQVRPIIIGSDGRLTEHNNGPANIAGMAP